MGVFEKEGNGALDSEWYAHLDRNWSNGNKELEDQRDF